MEDSKKPDFIVKLEEYTDAIIHNGDEPEMLAKLQQTIREYDIRDVDMFNPYANSNELQFDIDDAIGELEQSRTIAEMLLLRSWKTFKPAKYITIFSLTLNLAKCYQIKGDYSSVVNESEHVHLYFEDALDTSPDDFNIIGGICDILYHELNAKMELKEPFDKITNMINNYIQFLTVAADKDKYKLHAALIIGQIGDSFTHQKKYSEACNYYPRAIQIISQIERLDNLNKRAFAIFIGHYNVALLGCENKKWETIEKNLKMELSLYEQLNDSFGDIRSKMDLAIAYSHAGQYYELVEDYKRASDYNFMKIHLIEETFQIDDKASEYTEEARLDSLLNSMQPIINYGLLVDETERITIFKKVYSSLHIILSYKFDIRILGYSNAFAMEIFKASDGINDKNAEDFLFKKISVLVNLIVDYGKEDGIISDLQQTLKMGRPFINRIGANLQEHNKKIWEVVNKVV